MKLPKLRKGFTLIELLIVITIIGVLAVALVPRIVGAPAKARDAARKADLQQIATGLELYYDSEGSYPTEITSKCVSGTVVDDLKGSYLTSVPQDPNDNASSQCTSGYTYTTTSDGFVLSAGLEKATAANSATNVFGDKDYSSGTTAAWTPDETTDACTGASGSECFYYAMR